MNNKGNMIMVGTVIMLFVAIIVSLAIYSGGIAPAIGDVTLTKKTVNETITFPTNLTCTNLNGQAIYPDTTATNLIAINATSGVVIGTGNYTLSNKVVSNGVLVAQICGTTGIALTYGGRTANVSYTYEPYGYVSDTGSAAIIKLIAILSVLAIAMVVLKKIYDDGLMGFDFK